MCIYIYYIYFYIYIYLQQKTFNIIYLVFHNVRKILEEMHVILAPDDRHKEVCPDFLLTGFKNNKNLRDYLVRSHLPDSEETSMSKSCGRKRPLYHYERHMHNQKKTL